MAAAVAFVVVLAFFAAADAQKAEGLARPWMNPVVTRAEFAALDWVRANTAERAVFVTDIFGGELLMGQTLREGTEGGDWAIVPNVVERMSDVERFYTTSDAAEAHALARKYRAAFVWAPDRHVFAGFGWKEIERAKFSDAQRFERAYARDGMEIYRVK